MRKRAKADRYDGGLLVFCLLALITLVIGIPAGTAAMRYMGVM